MECATLEVEGSARYSPPLFTSAECSEVFASDGSVLVQSEDDAASIVAVDGKYKVHSRKCP